MTHTFLLVPALWKGEGKIDFNSSPDIIPFYTQWEVFPLDQGTIQAKQTVEMEGTEEILHNHFRITSLTPISFLIELTNELLGTVQGRGTLVPNQIGWEFRHPSTFDGFETYRLDEQGQYSLHAEYASPDQYRTIIDGRIWKDHSR